MKKEGRCTNFVNCTKANNKELIPIVDENTVCPECGLPLLLNNKRPPIRWIFALLAILVIIAVIIKACIFSEPNCKFGKNPDGSCIPEPICKLGKNPDGSCIPEPICKLGKNPDGSCITEKPSEGNCTIEPTGTPGKPNWYSVIEIGSKGIKPIAVEFKIDNGHYIPYTYDPRQPENVSPRDAAKIPDVLNALCKITNSLHADYGDIPVFLVGSSSMRETRHHEQLDKAIADKFGSLHSLKTPVIGEAVDYLTADREAEYSSKGIWVPPLPTKRHCQSLVVDVGSGNIKGGYIENCNPNEGNSPKEKFTTFEIPDFGTTAFTKRTSGEMSPYLEAAALTRNELAHKMDEQKQRHPHMLTSKTRIYVIGGAAWALNTLLCLDCPQYRERNITDDNKEYTVIRPSDIEEFYRFVTKHQDGVCLAEQNPYTSIDLDGGSKNLPRHKEDLDKHNHDLAEVCKVFKPDDLVSAAEIMRTLADKLGVSEKRTLFFMQKNLYTWSRQYLIEQLSKSQ